MSRHVVFLETNFPYQSAWLSISPTSVSSTISLQIPTNYSNKGTIHVSPTFTNAKSQTIHVGQLPHSSSSMSHSDWVLDFSALHHMSLDFLFFTSISPLLFIPIMTANDTSMPLACFGYVITSHLSLPNIYLILKFRLNLASVG